MQSQYDSWWKILNAWAQIVQTQIKLVFQKKPNLQEYSLFAIVNFSFEHF